MLDQDSCEHVMMAMQGRLVTFTALAQGLYYAFTGVWPLISMSSFLAVTGPKTDLWLVNTVGILVLCSGLVIFLAAESSDTGDPAFGCRERVRPLRH